jgi:ABC-type transport system involved in cytochrome bd biosynthesis fused ATPase/permease subunit
MDNFQQFSEDLFNKSVELLKSFKIIGWDYVQASVIICVLIPVIIFFTLILLLKSKKIKKAANKNLQ